VAEATEVEIFLSCQYEVDLKSEKPNTFFKKLYESAITKNINSSFKSNTK
jgi:hypothetical protein